MSKKLSTYSSSTYTFLALTNSLKDLLVNMDRKAFDDHGPTTFIQLYALIQGYLSQLFIDLLRNSEDYRACENEVLRIPYRVLTELIVKPEYRLDALRRNYRYLDIDLNQLDKENWDAINHLKNIRNLIAHGTPIVYHELRLRNLDTKSHEVMDSKFSIEETFKYLKNKGLIDYEVKKGRWTPGPDNRFEIFHFKVIQYFVHSCQEFIKNIRAIGRIPKGIAADSFISNFVEMEF